jgi:hypothetical protein
MWGVLAVGRDKREVSGNEHFAKMIRSTMNTLAWRSLSVHAQALYPWLKLEWKGPKANNNGKITMSVRKAADLLNCSRKTAAGAFHDLQAKGFIVITRQACLGGDGSAKSPTYELTELLRPIDKGERHDGQKLFLEWRPGHDFEVAKARTNNPTGTNKYSKACHPQGDSAVPPSRTSQPNTSSSGGQDVILRGTKHAV